MSGSGLYRRLQGNDLKKKCENCGMINERHSFDQANNCKIAMRLKA